MSQTQPTPDPGGPGGRPQDLLKEHGPALYAYAKQRLHQHDLCEDIVQETLLAALQSAEQFEGRSQKRTWLIGILRHKIADHFRKASTRREQPLSSLGEHQGTLGLYNKRKRWAKSPEDWGSVPADILQQKEFWRAYRLCRSKLPSTLADCYTLRELEGLSTEDVCKILDITATNLSVRMHRARLMLRHCLETNWFNDA